jgi:hypothetical protein
MHTPRSLAKYCRNLRIFCVDGLGSRFRYWLSLLIVFQIYPENVRKKFPQIMTGWLILLFFFTVQRFEVDSNVWQFPLTFVYAGRWEETRCRVRVQASVSLYLCGLYLLDVLTLIWGVSAPTVTLRIARAASRAGAVAHCHSSPYEGVATCWGSGRGYRSSFQGSD